MNLLVSVVIPCFNHGKFIDEAVNSVLNQTFQDFEIIIVNDGSTDEFTNELLKNYSKPKTKVIMTENQGVSVARNVGIKEAKGKYILPLDADDKILPAYLEKAVKIIEENTKFGIIYCEAEFFGAKTEKWNLPEYRFSDILNGNCIFCTALFRKSSWKKVNGYKKEMKNAWEDYEFWLSLIEIGEEVYRIPEVLFQYRQHKISSRNNSADARKTRLLLHKQIIKFHLQMYYNNLKFLKSKTLKMFILKIKIQMYVNKVFLYLKSHVSKINS